MAKDDQPSAHTDVDPEDPGGKGIAVPETDPSTAKDPADPQLTTQDLLKAEINLTNEQLRMMKVNEERDAENHRMVMPMYQSLMRDMAQPLPQPPSMNEPSPYGPPPDQQSQRQGILGGIMYGLIGMGLAKIFAGKNKYAYYGAIDGLGEALRQRNANQREDAEKSFDRWLKLNQLWHQQLRDRYDDYRTTLENRNLTEKQKMDMIELTAKLHGNIQTAAKARSEDLDAVASHIEHMQKMIQGSENNAWKIKQAWLKQMGHGEAIQLYKSFLAYHGKNADDQNEWAEAQANPKLNFDYWWATDYQSQKKYKPGEGERPKTSIEKEAQEKDDKAYQADLDAAIGPKNPQPAATPTPTPTPETPGGLLPYSGP